jgi:hypothetical protein
MNRLLKINAKLTRADLSIRGRLLGRALHVVRNNPDLLFRFLSENVPAFVRSGGWSIILEKRKAQPDAVRARDYCICFQRAFRELRNCRSKEMCCRSKGTYSISKQY